MLEHHDPIPILQNTHQVRCERTRFALDNKARAELLRLRRRKVVPAHHAIFRDGDRADHYYNITSGMVKLVKTLADGHQHIVSLLYASDFMGQSLNRRHTYAAEAATDVDLYVYPKAPFEQFLKTHPELERQIFHATLRELDLCRDWTLLLRRKWSHKRVAAVLLMMAKRVPREGVLQGNYVRFELPFTRAEMADYLGLTLETVSREFSKLKKKQVIALLSSRDIVIPDLELLSAVANGNRTLTEAKAATRERGSGRRPASSSRAFGPATIDAAQARGVQALP
jgi:CRP/FNR family transcriptional regulator